MVFYACLCVLLTLKSSSTVPKRFKILLNMSLHILMEYGVRVGGSVMGMVPYLFSLFYTVLQGHPLFPTVLIFPQPKPTGYPHIFNLKTHSLSSSIYICCWISVLPTGYKLPFLNQQLYQFSVRYIRNFPYCSSLFFLLAIIIVLSLHAYDV